MDEMDLNSSKLSRTLRVCDGFLMTDDEIGFPLKYYLLKCLVLHHTAVIGDQSDYFRSLSLPQIVNCKITLNKIILWRCIVRCMLYAFGRRKLKTHALSCASCDCNEWQPTFQI